MQMTKWEEVADETGRSYYVNRVTGETQWEAPPPHELLATTDDDEIFVDAALLARALAIRQRLVAAAPLQSPTHWIRMFDPTRHEAYYFDCVAGRLQSAAPEHLVLDDALAAWWLTLQCALRSALARRRVAYKRLQRRYPILPRPLALLSLALETESHREADERRGLLHAEKAQCSQSDRFWGLDQRIVEIRRQLVEESMLREAEEMRRKLNENARRREDSLRKAAEEQERKRRSEDSLIETHERQGMQLQELLQCKVDTFWGVQKQENDERCCQDQMLLEDAASARYAQDLLEAQLHARWALDAARALEMEKKKRLGEEIKFQKQYLKLFQRATTSQVVIRYRWPTLQVVELATKPKVATEDSAYSLDVVLDPVRRATPKHTFHSASGSHTVGRKGKLEISQPPPCFRLDQPSPHPKKPLNPNQPASANGLPFRVPTNAGVEAVLGRPLEKRKSVQLPSMVIAPSNQQPEPTDTPQVVDDSIDVASIQEQFGPEEVVLQQIFELIDTDHGGTIDKDEMMWALTRDAVIHKLAMTSVVFRDVLKKRNLEALFEEMDASKTGAVPWHVFRSYCEKTFFTLQLETARKLRLKGPQVLLSKEERLQKKNDEYKARKAILDQEEAIAKLVFALVDTDHSGTIDQKEMMQALELNEHVRAFVQRSSGLQPLLTNPTFAKAFIGMATDVEKGMGLDEFMCFCTEIASVAMLNGMVPST
ncbi:hypothetical protein SDRG_08551 [Saprolegnia diclina VS20]|uniref:Uncharacterized protein n=1 Tax=Saprolegnia diclina (strain VS20) TaxID=1156394 RepID=T0QJE4_SAPDV|nr:hypothetical protein SDRG_08551 [Saprolegnia diclina VS20]EQC33870.1 hypothetical protein SDRG_08551 [Saprolegnia diclina VS20]|eukprot:XP_008612665.1 hypothetical protein SDRG_08551 [Saprolegnia diclina VS20]